MQRNAGNFSLVFLYYGAVKKYFCEEMCTLVLKNITFADNLGDFDVVESLLLMKRRQF